MPVVLPEEHYDHWLRPETSSGDPREELLVPYPDPEEVEAYPVSRRVNDPSCAVSLWSQRAASKDPHPVGRDRGKVRS